MISVHPMLRQRLSHYWHSAVLSSKPPLKGRHRLIRHGSYRMAAGRLALLGSLRIFALDSSEVNPLVTDPHYKGVRSVAANSTSRSARSLPLRSEPSCGES